MIKKVILISLLAIVSFVGMRGQDVGLFKPYKHTNLRLPAVPVIVSDPYFSIWSPYNCLNEGATCHWTGDKKPLNGLLRVDGTTFRFMGADSDYLLETIVPMADEKAWSAEVKFDDPGKGWQNEAFDTKGWKTLEAAFGSKGEYSHVRTAWSAPNSDIYVRRSVELSAEDACEDLYLIFSHDDVFELYINGKKVVDTGETRKMGEVLHLDGKLKGLLKPGRNIIAAHCHNTSGGAYVDFGVSKNIKKGNTEIVDAVQKRVDVMATSTYYTFACGPVELDLVFTAPMLIDDLDLLSMPINYVSYQVRSVDRKQHDVQFYLSATPEMAVDKVNQPTISTLLSNKNGMDYVRTGTIEQPILAKTGDNISIDWGYFYMPAVNGTVALAGSEVMDKTFIETGKLALSKDRIESRKASEMPILAYVHDFGKITDASSFTMLGYDEIDDIEYMYHRYKGYWARHGKTIFQAFDELKRDYSVIMDKCRAFDKRIYDDALAAGNVKYAEILSGSYRHVIAAHKLFEDNEGHLLFFSKENNSDGCVNTVDLTYPEAPLFLVYNPELQKAMMTSIFEYSYTGRWIKPFAAHDLGFYPKANGQTYPTDMPVEEAGNMLILAAMISKLDGNTNYVNKYWNVIKHDGRYYLTYSANDYRSQDYAVGYATATSPLGPWTKYAGNPILHKVENLVGTGHHSLFSDKNGGLRMVFHAHHSLSEVQPRCMYIGSVAFEGDKLVMTQDRIIRPVLK